MMLLMHDDSNEYFTKNQIARGECNLKIRVNGVASGSKIAHFFI
jgi:hypothetical protein